jgi:hypothetical protein
MVLIPRHNATAVIDWLDANIAPNVPYRVPDIERTEDSRKNPYRVSATAQIAYWQSENREWQVTQWSRKRTIEVQCQDAQIETVIALKWGS